MIVAFLYSLSIYASFARITNYRVWNLHIYHNILYVAPTYYIRDCAPSHRQVHHTIVNKSVEPKTWQGSENYDLKHTYIMFWPYFGCGSVTCCNMVQSFYKSRNLLYCKHWLNLYQMSLVLRKPVFGVSDQVPHKPGCTATEDG